MIEDYIKARRIGEREVHRAASRGQYPYTPALDDFIEPGLPEFPVGVTEIPISMVAGTRSADRQNAFSSGFMPILSDRSEFALKWSNLYDAQMDEGIRDAIKVYEYMRRFYVQEGNKRLSVMKYLKMPLILADVTRLVPKYSDEKEVRVYYEFMDFYKVAPIYELGFSEEGSYALLAELLGQDLEHPWSETVLESVRSAYYYFLRSYESKNGFSLKMTPSDAFLTYLKIYDLDSLLNETVKVIGERIDRIWNELLVAAQTESEKIRLVETPHEIERAASVSQDSVSGILTSFLRRPTTYSESHPLRIAFLYDKTPETSGWLYGHELGRHQLEETFGGLVETVRFDNCQTETEIRRAVEAAVADMDELIITTSPAQMNETLRCAIDYPKIKFMNCSVNLSHNAVRTYYGRMYEAKFLMGALAAQEAKNHRIGYRADYPIYGTIANINAFAIGAAMVDPKSEIYLSWSTKKETDWREEMKSEGVEVISGPDLIVPEAASREYGIYKYREDGSIQNIAMPVWNWGRYYELIVRTLLEGTWDAKGIARKDQAVNYWWGLESQVIDVILSDKISYYSRKLTEMMKHAMTAGSLNPFDGELRSQSGVIKKADAPGLTNDEIIRMNWLNDNIIGTIPKMDELQESARETVQVSGVIGQ